jgi:subtilisin-like proprotein convertase family protein
LQNNSIIIYNPKYNLSLFGLEVMNMKKSLTAFLFEPIVRNHFPPIIILLLIFNYFSISAQESVPHSLGLAPSSDKKIGQQVNETYSVGTRAFHLISSSPTFQLGKSFMETCNITNIGAPFTMTSPGGLVLRNGVLYTWNQTTPFQLYSIDTVAGVRTFIVNITGVPMSNLTGMCWDGTTMYAVCTNISSSQLLSFNTTTGACTPVGSPSATCPGAVCLFGRMFSGSSLYSYDMVNDDLYRWNKTTGIATLIGPAGFTINQGIGACFDGNTAYINANSQLRRWDTTGSSALLCTYTSNPIGIACVPHGAPPGIVTSLCRNGLNLSIPDNSAAGIRDTIKMTGNTNCTVFDINIKIDTFTHSWLSDMSFTLNHNAATVALFTNLGGSGDNIIGCTFDDSAAIPITAGTPPYTGSFRPMQPLNVFNTTHSPQGNWMLHMADIAAGDTGILKAWCITFFFSCPLGGVQQVEVPFTYRLYQNYPNPFNPVTTIKYGLPKYGNTKLVVYDILGKVVATLVDNELKDAGTYEVQWDASNFSSGIYFYTLESGNYKETKRMVLIR